MLKLLYAKTTFLPACQIYAPVLLFPLKIQGRSYAIILNR